MGGVCGTTAQRAEIRRLYDYCLFLQLMGPDRVETIVRHAHLRRVEGGDADGGGGHPATGRVGQIALVFDGTVELFYNGSKVHVIHARMPLDNGPPLSIVERPKNARYAPEPAAPASSGASSSTPSHVLHPPRPHHDQQLTLSHTASHVAAPATVKTDEALLYWKSDSEIVCRYALETGGDEFILKSVLCDRVELRARSRFLTLASKYLVSPRGESVPTLNALTNTDLIGALAGVPFFAGLPTAMLEILTEMSAIRVYPSNCVIFREDEGMSTQLFITLAGALEVTSSRAAAPLARLEPGSFFGEMSLLINIPRAATVRAVENCMLLSVEKRSFHTLLERSPELRASVHRLLKERLLLKAMASGVLPYFSSVPLARLVALSHGMDIDDQIRKGDCVLDQQADDPRFFFLVYGALEISSAGYQLAHDRDNRSNRGSNRDNAVFLTPGCYLGPFTFQRLNMRRGKVHARTPVVVLSCPFERILELFREFPDVAAAANIAWFGERCDLASVLRHALLTQRFQAFLEAEHSDENFLFCLDVERFRAAADARSASREDDPRRLATRIYERYIQPNAPKEINLPSNVRAAIVARVSGLGEAEDPGAALFDAAWDEIMRLMTKDSFPRFKKSPMFQSVLDSLDPLAGRKGSKVLDACHAFRESLHDLRPGQIENVKSNQLNRMMSTIRKSHARHQQHHHHQQQQQQLQQRGRVGARSFTLSNLRKPQDG